jgi:hypothetical protein
LTERLDPLEARRVLAATKELLDAGLGLSEIAERLGVTGPTIRSIAHARKNKTILRAISPPAARCHGCQGPHTQPHPLADGWCAWCRVHIRCPECGVAKEVDARDGRAVPHDHRGGPRA